MDLLEEYTARCEREAAEWVIKEGLKNCTRIALVDTGLQLTETHREHARENARFHNLSHEEVK